MTSLSSFTTLLFFGLIVAEFTDISQVCQKIQPKFTPFGSSVPLDYDLATAYTDGEFVGKGGFGEVRKAYFDFNGIEEVAIKQVRNQPEILAEFDVLAKFSPIGVGPTFYGCQYDRSKVLIAQTLLYKDLSKESTIYRFKTYRNSELIARIRDVVDSLKTMWDNGYVHNDIKEHNIMTNPDFSRFYLIDFGLAQKKSEYMRMQGTPFYFSPEKWTERYKRPAPRDDLYAVALTVGILESVYGFDSLVTYENGNGMMYELPGSCFKKGLTSHCQQVLKMNVRRALTKANFGNYHRSSELRQVDTINFTTLMALMINYSDYPFDYAETVKVLDRLVAEFQQIEKGGERAYVPKTKNRLFTDPEDKPDTFEFGRKYPRVHPDELAFFEQNYHALVVKALEEEELRKEIWDIEKEKKKLVREQEELERTEREEEERLRKEKAEQEKLAREELKKKLEKEREEKARKELLEKERLRKEQAARDAAIQKKRQEELDRKKLAAQQLIKGHQEKLDNNLRVSQKKLQGLEGKQQNTHTNSKMFLKKPLLFQAVQVEAQEGDNPEAMEEEKEVIAPKAPLKVAPVVTKIQLQDAATNAKKLNINALWPQDQKPKQTLKDLEKKVDDARKGIAAKKGQDAIESGLAENQLRFDVNKRVIFRKPVKEIPQPDAAFKTAVPVKKLEPGNKRMYVYLNGKAVWQKLNEHGAWIDTNEPVDENRLPKRKVL